MGDFLHPFWQANQLILVDFVIAAMDPSDLVVFFCDFETLCDNFGDDDTVVT